MNLGKCPGCRLILDEVLLEAIKITQPFQGGPTYNGVSYVCPNCKVILGVGIDPVSLMNDTVTAVVQRLQKG
jgi:hypothetical protein